MTASPTLARALADLVGESHVRTAAAERANVRGATVSPSTAACPASWCSRGPATS